MSDPREKLFYWDGKQVKLSDFLTELGIDPDDTDCSWEQVCKNNKVEY